MDFIPAKPAAFRKVAKRAKWKIAKSKRAFLVSGEDRVGAGAKLLGKLAEKRINVIAIDAVCAGKGRYGALLWVSPAQYARAARTLGAR
jgi:ACT domain-containing protein